MTGILEERQRELFEQEQSLAKQLQTYLVGFKGADEYVHMLDELIAGLEELFLLVVMGEFNAGKSAFINALLGDCVLKEGIIPTTTQVTKLRFGSQEKKEEIDKDQLIVFHPSDFLQDISIVDTPGSNAVARIHELITKEFIPKSDFILFIILARKGFAETERKFLGEILLEGKEVVIIINGIDEISPKNLKTLEDTVKKYCIDLLKFHPLIFPISARYAQLATIRHRCDDTESETVASWEVGKRWEDGRFTPLKNYLTERLGEVSRMELKLRNPLITMQTKLREIETVVDNIDYLIEVDKNAIDTIKSRSQTFCNNILQTVLDRLNGIENIILNMRTRGDGFFDDTIRIGRIYDVIHREQVRDEFEQEVVGDSEKLIKVAVQDLIDWYVEQKQRFWQDLMDYVERTQQVGASRYFDDVIKLVDREIDADRHTELQTLAQHMRETVDLYNPQEEADQVTERLWKAIFATLGTGIGTIGGIGLGTGIIALFGITTAGIGSLVVAGVFSIFTLVLIPGQRKSAKRRFHRQMTKLQATLHEDVVKQFKKELSDTSLQVKENTEPYENFVKTVIKKKNTMRRNFIDINKSIEKLLIDISKIGK